jgi:hypothetical protein
MYKQIRDDITGEIVEGIVQRESDGACIPVDTNNRDYRKCQKWISKGNAIKLPEAK